MRASLPLLALAVGSVNAIGIIDNALVKLKIIAQAVTFDAGEYVVKNAATGEYLAFRRPDDTTNVHTEPSFGTITLTHGGAKGMSGVNFGQYSGTIMAGGNGKCGSAQWGFENGLGVDVAFVSYACSVGDNPTGTDTLEVAKQFWRIVPCGDSSDSSEGVADTSAGLKLNVVDKESSNDAATASFSSVQSTNTHAAAAPAAPAVDSDNDGDDDAWTPQATQTVDKYDRKTWVCQHQGKWLARHPLYITEGNHPECADDLAAYQASLKKRSNPPSHKALAKKLRRGAATSGRYCIIAEDHLGDMTTRAVTSQVVTSFGGYISQGLADYNPHDINQQWDIYAA